MVSLNPSVYGNPALALALYRPEALAAHQAKPIDTTGRPSVNLIPGDGNVDDFIYDPAGKFTSGRENFPDSATQESAARASDVSANFWEHPGKSQKDIEKNNPAYRHFQELIAESGGYEENAIKDIAASPQNQAVKEAVVRDEAPKRANDLIMWTSGLNNFIAASKTEQYQTDEAYRNKIDALTGRLKDIISNNVRYLTSQTSVSGTLIQANNDGTYSIPDFTIGYDGDVVYAHSSTGGLPDAI